MTSPRRSALAATALLLAATLAGCGGDDSSGPDTPQVEIDVGASGSAGADAPADPTGPSSEPPVSPGDPPPVRDAPEQGDELEDRYGVWALDLPRKDPAKIVAQALVDYVDARLGSFHEVEADLATLGRVSVGQPLTEIQGYVLDLQESGQHTVGDVWITVRKKDVEVRRAAATITDACARNASANVSDGLVAQESPTDAYLLDATLVRAAPDVWLVSEVVFEAVDSCDPGGGSST